MAGADQLGVYMQTAVKYSALGVVHIESVVFHRSLHMHYQMDHTSHFLIFSTPKPGGGVYLWGPNNIILAAWAVDQNLGSSSVDC